MYEYYSRKFYEVCYSHEVSGMNGKKLWKNAKNPHSILPPGYKRGLSRPKKLRRKEADEDLNPTKLRKKTTKYQCRRCGKPSHNQRKCDFPPPIVEELKNEGTIIQPRNEANAEGGIVSITNNTLGII